MTESILNQDVEALSFTVVDVETTGMGTWQGHRVCEIGIHKFTIRADDETDGEYQTLINPKRDISPGAQNVNGITHDMVRDAPVFEQVAEDIYEHLNDSVLVMHNAPFDLGFLWTELRSAGLHLPDQPVVDTCRLARRQFSFSSNSLDHLVSQIDEGTAEHRALADVRDTRTVLTYLINHLPDEQSQTGNDLVQAQGGPISPPQNPSRDQFPEPLEQALANTESVKISYRTKNGSRTIRRITPHLLGHRKQTYYLISYCHLRNDQRCFRVDRIDEVLDQNKEENEDAHIFNSP